MKRGAGGFTELVAEIPGEVIAALEAVMAGNLMHGVAADGLLYVWGAEGHHPQVVGCPEEAGLDWSGWIKPAAAVNHPAASSL